MEEAFKRIVNIKRGFKPTELEAKKYSNATQYDTVWH